MLSALARAVHGPASAMAADQQQHVPWQVRTSAQAAASHWDEHGNAGPRRMQLRQQLQCAGTSATSHLHNNRYTSNA